MPETNNPTPNVPQNVSDARAKFEQEKMTRRSALRKLGMTSGMALFGVFAIDDLARVALKTLEKHKETQAIADSIAHDFKDMGVAFAEDDGGDYYIQGRGLRHTQLCQGCVQTKEDSLRGAFAAYESCQDNADKLGISGSKERNDALTACYDDYFEKRVVIAGAYTKCCSTYRCNC